MRCCILGAGATGGFLAVKLGLAGHSVSAVARGGMLTAIQRDGLRLQQDERVHVSQPRAVADTRGLGVQDIVFVTTKATALESIAAQIGPLVGDETLVLFLQNGMPWWYPTGLADPPAPLPAMRIFRLAETFLALMRPDQVLGGVVYSANEVVRPGVVRNNSPRSNAVEIAGITDVATDAVHAARRLLEDSGIHSPPVADIRHAVWLKLVVNASASSLCVATGHPAAMVLDQRVQTAFLRMVDEGIAVAGAHGHDLKEQLDLARWTRHRAAHKPSMLQDFEAGRPMEIEEMILAPVAFARAAGVATPTLDALASVVARLAIDKGLYTDGLTGLA